MEIILYSQLIRFVLRTAVWITVMHHGSRNYKDRTRNRKLDDNFIELEAIPCAIRYKPRPFARFEQEFRISESTTNLNDYEIAFAPPGKILGANRGIYKYDMCRNEWTFFIKYTSDLRLEGTILSELQRENWEYDERDFISVSLAFDSLQNILYFKPKKDNLPLMYDLSENCKLRKLQNFIMYDSDDDSDESDCIDRTVAPTHVLTVGAEIHIISVSALKHHAVFDWGTRSFKMISMNIMNHDADEEAFAIYVPSKDVMILLGGFRDDIGNMSREAPFGKGNIYICRREEVETQWKWMCLEQRYKCLCSGDMIQPTGVLSSDGNYLIIASQRPLNGDEHDEKHLNHSDKIYILDMSEMKESTDWKNMKVNECSIRSPFKECQFAMFRTGNIREKRNVLVSGYVRDCFKREEFKLMDLPPVYLVQMMACYHDEEMIHWLKEHDGLHRAIPLRCLLSSRICNVEESS